MLAYKASNIPDAASSDSAQKPKSVKVVYLGGKMVTTTTTVTLPPQNNDPVFDSRCLFFMGLHQGDQGPMLSFLKYFRRKILQKYWRFLLKLLLVFAKLRS
jgi:hypothetical protein